MLKNVRKQLKAKDLKGIIDLPNYPDDQIIDIMISPGVEEKKLTPEEIREAINSVRGVFKNTKYKNMTRDEIRMERLESKYAPFN